MKKKDLLNMEKLYATSKMLKTAENDKVVTKYRSWTDSWSGEKHHYPVKVCTYGRYLRATQKNGILKVSLFTSASLKAGCITPSYDVYISKSEDRYLSYDNAEDKWRTAKINMLEHSYTGLIMEKDWQDEPTRKMVNEYFQTGLNLGVYEAVLDFQAGIEKGNLHQKHKSEIEEIDATMKEVPETPKNFNAWVVKNCFEEYLLYKTDPKLKKQTAYCTHCGKMVKVNGKPKHGEKTTCPSCKVEATYRSWNKQKYLESDCDVAVLQMLEDRTGYILRKFDCRIKRRAENGWDKYESFVFEETREKLGIHFGSRELFEFGQFKYTGIDRWCHNATRGGFGYYNDSFGNAYMYTPNLKRELEGNRFANMDLKKAFKGGERKRVDPGHILRRLDRYPFIEYLQKSGLHKIVSEIINNEENADFFDTGKTRIDEVLMLDKQRFQRLRKLNGNCQVLGALQYEKQSGEKVSDQNIAYITENVKDINKIIELCQKTGMNIQRMLNYLQRQQEKTKQSLYDLYQHYEDYLNMEAARGMNIKDEIVCHQAEMMKYHDAYVEERDQIKNSNRDKQVDKTFKNIASDYQKNQEHFAFESKNFVMMVPRKGSDITKEGRQQHHCVGASDNYIKKMNNRETFILFLRKKEMTDQPYYTIEAKWDGKILQWYAAYDRKPDEKQVKKVLDQWSRQVKRHLAKEKAIEQTVEIRERVLVAAM